MTDHSNEEDPVPETPDEYKVERKKDREIELNMVDLVQKNMVDTGWHPPDSMLQDALVVMVWVDDDGDYYTTWLNATSVNTAEGAAHRVLRDIEAMDNARRDRIK